MVAAPRLGLLILAACSLPNESFAFTPTLPAFLGCASTAHIKSFLQTQQSKHTTLRRSNNWEWDGDDLRFFSRLRRRWRRSISSGQDRPVRNTILLTTALVFVYQVFDAVRWIVQRHPSYWPGQAPYMIWDVLMANYIPGPLERDFRFASRLASFQPHRYLTHSLLHRGLVHLVLNMNEIRRQPAWLETGLGGSLYLTTFLMCNVLGCVGHMSWGLGGQQSFLMGCSAGICGLYGLQFASLARMGNSGASYKALLGVGIVSLYSLLLGDNVISGAAHVAGFLGGIVSAILLGPSYSKSYQMTRKWSTYVDNEPKDYRVAMGFGIQANRKGVLPLPLLWVGLLAVMVTIPKYRSIPTAILQGLIHPGSYS